MENNVLPPVYDTLSREYIVIFKDQPKQNVNAISFAHARAIASVLYPDWVIINII